MRQTVKYNVYDTARNVSLGSLTKEELNKLIGINPAVVSKLVDGQRLYKKRYMIRYAENYKRTSNRSEIPNYTWKRWDEVCRMTRKCLATTTWDVKRKALNELQPKWREEISLESEENENE